MKRPAFIALALVLFLSGTVPGQKKAREQDLGQKYRSWLNLTAYIMLPQEKEVFLKLTTDRDRDIFMESFWKQRDPTPGTPQNEYQDEIIRRFNYAQRRVSQGHHAGRLAHRSGEILHHPRTPNSIERFDGQREIRPCQVWYYYGDVRKGLPTYFGLVFFRRSGVGEYQLYDPLTDGPAQLLRDTFACRPQTMSGSMKNSRSLRPPSLRCHSP